MLPTATKSTTLASLTTFKQWLNWTSAGSKSISALSSSGTVATATCAGHGFRTGQLVVIAGVVTAGYNGEYIITVVDANTFTFNLAATAATPAAGTMTATLDDARYAAIVDAACAELERQCGVYFVERTITDEYYDGNNPAQLALRSAPVVSVTSITIDDGTVLTSSDWILEKDSGIVTLINGVFTTGTRNIKVSYVAGYDVQDGAALPSDAVRACLDLAKAIVDELVSNAIAASSISIGPSSMVIKPSKMPQSVQRVVDSYAGDGWQVR